MSPLAALGSLGLGRFAKRLCRDRRGNIAVMTALLMLPLIGLGGLAVDHIVVSMGKSKCDQASDAAALAAVRAAAKAIQAGTPVPLALQAGQQAGLQVFAANAGQLYNVATPTPTIVVNPPDNANVLTSSVSYATTGSLVFGRMFGVPTTSMSNKAAASMVLPSYINVYLMIDTSGSTSIGASSADEQTLIQTTGCAFACHDGNPVNGYADAYTYAEAAGIQLRYDVINKGVLSFLNQVDASDPTHQYIGVSLYSFDSTLQNLTGGPTKNTALARNQLPKAPATSGEYDGATHFNESIGSVMSDIGLGGNGISPSSPKKLLIIATDGVEDPSRSWTWNLPLRPLVTVIDTTFCPVLKSENVTVAFIHMPYLPMTWDWGYMATLGQPANNGTAQTRVDLVQPALQACAGNYYTLANDTTSLTNAFSQIFQAYVGVRLTN